MCSENKQQEDTTENKVNYFDDLIELYESCCKLLSRLGHPIYQLRQCERTWSKTELGVCRSTINTYTNHIIGAFCFICNGNRGLSKGIKEKLCKLWIVDFRDIIKTTIQPWTPWNSACIKKFTNISQRSLEIINNLAKGTFGFFIFSTRAGILKVIRRTQAIRDHYFRDSLRPTDENSHITKTV